MNPVTQSAKQASGRAAEVLRRFAWIFVPASLLLGAIVSLLYCWERANERLLLRQEASHIVDLHAEIVSREFKSVESDLLYLAGQAKLREFLSGGNATRQELAEEYLLFCRNKGLYDQIRYLDESGDESIRINFNAASPAIVADSELQSKAARYYFAETMALHRNEVFVSPFDLNVEHGAIERPFKPVVRFATPVFDRNGDKRGILVLNYLGVRLIAKLNEVSARFPGSAMLVNQDGYFLRGRQPSDEWGFMFGNERTFEKNHPEAWRRIASAAADQFVMRDGMFTARALAMPARSATAVRVRERSDGPVAAATSRDPALLVVAHVPNKVLYGKSTQLLQRLSIVLAVAVVLLSVLALYLARAGALRREHERRIEESEERLRMLSTRLLTAQEDERRSISRDLHDELGQVVTAITLDLERSAQLDSGEKKDKLIRLALDGTRCLLDKVHQISARVRPTMLDDLGLKDAVQSYLSEFEQASEVAVRADLRFERQDVPAAVSQNVYRILQEALTNVSKHAGAREVIVAMHVARNDLTLTVRDDGAGFRSESVNGERLGLLGMRERAELLGGAFALESEPGNGTEIRVAIRLDGE